MIILNMIFILCFIFFSKLSAQTKLSSEDETLSGHLQEDHRRGDIFHYEEDKAIQDPLLLAEEYKSPSSLNDPKYLFELSLIEGGFGELNPFPPNMTSSWSYLTSSAKLGHAGALHKLASAYFTGVYGGHRIPVDIGRSIVLDQMSALAGYAPAHVSLGYKHLKGLGVKASCERAAVHYEFAANAVVNRILRRGYALQNERIHLSQLERKLNKNELSNDLLQYYHHAALDGDVLAATNLGTIYLYGTRTAPQNVSKALYYLKTGYQWGGVAAAGLLGYTLMHLHMAYYTSGTNADLLTEFGHHVKDYLRYASNRADPNAIVGTAIGYMYGIAGFEKDLNKSYHLISKNPDMHVEAGFYLGELFSGLHTLKKYREPIATLHEDEGFAVDTVKALQYYSVSSRKGSLLALHRISLALLHAPPPAKQLIPVAAGQSPCSTAVAGLKLIAEADICGVHLSPFSSRRIIGLTAAHDALANDDPQLALDIFLEIAAQGVESAQTNAAFLLTRYDLLKEALETQASETESVFEALPAIVNSSNLMHSGLRVGSESIALHLYSLSSAQGNVEAFLQIGDIYYYGRAGLKPDKHAAVTSYQAGADLRHPHALFNLGLMYEIGDGVAQDFHLAKRYYDQAADFDFEAKLPRNVAVFSLQVHERLQSIFGDEAMSAFVHHAVAIATEIQRFFVHFALTFRHRITGGNRAKTERRTNKGLFRSPKRSQNDTGHPWAMLIEIIRGEAFLDTLLVLFLSTIFWLIWSLKMARRRRAVLS